MGKIIFNFFLKIYFLIISDYSTTENEENFDDTLEICSILLILTSYVCLVVALPFSLLVCFKVYNNFIMLFEIFLVPSNFAEQRNLKF